MTATQNTEKPNMATATDELCTANLVAGHRIIRDGAELLITATKRITVYHYEIEGIDQDGVEEKFSSIGSARWQTWERELTPLAQERKQRIESDLPDQEDDPMTIAQRARARKQRIEAGKAANYAKNPRTIDTVDSVLRFLTNHREQAVERLLGGNDEWMVDRSPLNFWHHLTKAEQGRLIAMAIEHYAD